MIKLLFNKNKIFENFSAEFLHFYAQKFVFYFKIAAQNFVVFIYNF